MLNPLSHPHPPLTSGVPKTPGPTTRRTDKRCGVPLSVFVVRLTVHGTSTRRYQCLDVVPGTIGEVGGRSRGTDDGTCTRTVDSRHGSEVPIQGRVRGGTRDAKRGRWSGPVGVRRAPRVDTTEGSPFERPGGNYNPVEHYGTL